MSDTEQRQRDQAYVLWQQAGQPEGRAHEFWEQAGYALDGETSPDEKTDVAMEDTFPASDPPSHGGITGPDAI